MIQRDRQLKLLQARIQRHRIIGLLGARQVGKTTLAKMLLQDYPEPTWFFDLENPQDLARLSDPWLALKDLRGLIVIDEVQHSPGLFQILRVLADRDPLPSRFLILGSAAPELLRQSAETLAGRIFYQELEGLCLNEVGSQRMDQLWERGGFPRSFLAETELESAEWRYGFIRTFLERDIPQFGINIPAIIMRRFWTMLAHYHGQIWNASELARSFGLSSPTIQHYLHTLASTLMIRILQPWHANLAKRQVKSPKIFISDTGILHSLFNLTTREELLSHPKVGASWEGFAMSEVIQRLGVERENCFFWATHAGAKLDLLVQMGSLKRGFEFKRSSQPSISKSMRIALEDLNLESLTVIHPGDKSFPLGEKIWAVALSDVWTTDLIK